MKHSVTDQLNTAVSFIDSCKIFFFKGKVDYREPKDKRTKHNI